MDSNYLYESRELDIARPSNVENDVSRWNIQWELSPLINFAGCRTVFSIPVDFLINISTPFPVTSKLLLKVLCASVFVEVISLWPSEKDERGGTAPSLEGNHTHSASGHFHTMPKTSHHTESPDKDLL